uniref:Uncharacterized protein n=1 Tax=Corethrella appendiculata TaxID=1370023 RepID=U5ES16_9DIPT
MEKLKKFIIKYQVTLVMIPTIIGIHWSWERLQNNELLVTKDERKDLPIVIFAKYVYGKLTGTLDESNSNSSEK